MKLQLDKWAAVPRAGDWEENGPALEVAKDVDRDQQGRKIPTVWIEQCPPCQIKSTQKVKM